MDSLSILAEAGMGHAVAFYALSAVTVGGAVLMVLRKNPVASVLWLVVSFVGLAGLFLILQAYFLAVIQVLVYAGAIMVLFLFVIMLLDLRREEVEGMKMPPVPLVGLAAAVLFFGAMVAVIGATDQYMKTPIVDLLQDPATMPDSVVAVGLPLFKQWILPFEAVSILLLAAIVGSVVLTKKKL